MITISLCMIVKDEEFTLERCLQSVDGVVDEIVIADTGSTDDTKRIAKAWTNKVFDYKWHQDFASARNFSFSKATKDYILWLDADDVLLPKDKAELLNLKETMSKDIDAVSMSYDCDFDTNGNVALSVRRNRLIKRTSNFRWEGVVHEDLMGNEQIYNSTITVTHKKPQGSTAPDRNLKIYEHLIHNGGKLRHRDLLHYAMELHQHKRYDESITHYQSFLNHPETTDEDKIFVLQKLADCYYQTGDEDSTENSTFQSFKYDTPRSESCCRLGYLFLQRGKYPQAVFWYKLALQVPVPENQWATQNQISRTWLPHLQLGLCYFKIGDYKLSYHHNQRALNYLPDDENILHNIELLRELIRVGEASEILSSDALVHMRDQPCE